MSDPGIARLEALARGDPTIAPLAGLLALAFAAADDAGWAAPARPLAPDRLLEGTPLLHGAELAVDPARLRRLFGSLAAAVGLGQLGRLDALGPVAASIRQDAATLAELAAAAGVAPDLLGTLASAAALPLLQAARRAGDDVSSCDAGNAAAGGWSAGFCPLCAAWPTLAELRGLARERWLRCGRCGSGWRPGPSRCPYCASVDHRQLGYLAPAADRESRRASTCDGCGGYLKTVSVLGASSPAELALRDLETLDLDLAALDRGYARPAAPAFRLVVALAPAPPSGLGGRLRRLAGRA